MATTMIENGMEVPSVPSVGLKPSNVPTLSSTVVHSSHASAAKIPLFDEDGYEEWVVPKMVAARMAAYEAQMGKVSSGIWKKVLLDVFERDIDRALNQHEHTLCWTGVPAKKKKKSVSFFADVPYKHSERTGEIFEGPVTSQLTFEKERGEDGPVYVNPENLA
jgi:hypothetical protein